MSTPPILAALSPPIPKKAPAVPQEAWRTLMKPGSLNGVPFLADSTNSKFGRRVVRHLFPGRDLPYFEDMGKRGREFVLQVFVIGSNYMTGRDALITEIELPGLKRLVHPWYGRMTICVMECDVLESIKEGGAALMTLHVSEAAGNVLPAVEPVPAAATLAKVKDAHKSVIASMKDTVLNAATYVQTKMQDVIGAIDTAYQDLVSALPFPAGVLDVGISAAESAIRGQSPLTAILGQWSTPAGVLSGVVSLASGTNGMLANMVQLGYSALLRAGALNDLGVSNDFFGGSPLASPKLVLAPKTFAAVPVAFAPRPVSPLALVQAIAPAVAWPSVPANTPEQIQAADNLAAMQAAVAQVVVIEQARLSAALAYASKQDALAVRDYLCGQLSDVALTAAYDVYVQLQQLRAAVHADLTAQANADPGVVSVALGATLPALVAAYHLYGDASREVDILSRNPLIDNPVFVPGGIELEVLSA